MGIFDGLFSLFQPAPLVRTVEEQMRVDGETAFLSLYHFGVCPYCQRVRRAITRLALKIELRDIRTDQGAHEELIRAGGQDQVPCLRVREPGVGERWLYESADIIDYLAKRFG